MIWENGLLYLILALYGISFVALVLGRARSSRASLAAASAAGMVGFPSFAYLFLSNNFSTTQVFENSSRALSIPFKVVAALENAGGSLLLWLTMMSAALLVYVLMKRHPSRVAALVVTVFTLYVSIALIFVNPFAQLGGSFSNGLGLTPSLQSYWALIHPPTIFSSYTAMVFLFASMVSQRWNMKRGENPTPTDGRLFTATWFLLGLGLLLGGIWAYQTEGWGGYWAWDPIETSALVPWIALTAVLISSRVGSQLRNQYAFFGTTYSASTLLFASYVARGSAAPSVHSYGDIVTGAPFITLSLLPVLIAAVTVAAKGNMTSLGSAFRNLTSEHALEFWCIMLLASANLVLLLMETVAPDFGVMFLPSADAHDLASFPFVVGLCVLLATSAIHRGPSSRRVFTSGVIGLVWVLVFVLALLLTQNLIFDLVLPSAVVLLAAGLLALAAGATSKHEGFRSSTIARYATMVGIAILLMGVLFSSSMRTSAEANLGPGQSLNIGGVQLTVHDITTSMSSRTVYLPTYGSVSETIDTAATYTLGGQSSGVTPALLQYFPGRDSFVPIPSIRSSMSGDLYVVITQTPSVVQTTSAAFFNKTLTDPSTVTVTAQFIPGVSFVWLGAAILLLANLPFALMKGRGEGEDTDSIGSETLDSNDVDQPMSQFLSFPTFGKSNSQTQRLPQPVRSCISNNENRLSHIYPPRRSRAQVKSR